MAFGALAASESGRPAEAQRFLAVGQAAYEGRPFAMYTDLVCRRPGRLRLAGPARSRVVGRAGGGGDPDARHGGLALGGVRPLPPGEIGSGQPPPRRHGQGGRRSRTGRCSRLDRDLYRGFAALARAGDALVAQRHEEAAAPPPKPSNSSRRRAGSSPPGPGSSSASPWCRSTGPSARTPSKPPRRSTTPAPPPFAATAPLDRLRRFGHAGKRAAASAGDPTLTPREHDVARLAALGHTAPEIAATLVIGTRTVETHLVRIYAKLGVASKRELVRRAAEFGLLDRGAPWV